MMFKQIINSSSEFRVDFTPDNLYVNDIGYFLLIHTSRLLIQIWPSTNHLHSLCRLCAVIDKYFDNFCRSPCIVWYLKHALLDNYCEGNDQTCLISKSSGRLSCPQKLQKMSIMAAGPHFLNCKHVSTLPGLMRAGSSFSKWFVVITIIRP